MDKIWGGANHTKIPHFTTREILLTEQIRGYLENKLVFTEKKKNL